MLLMFGHLSENTEESKNGNEKHDNKSDIKIREDFPGCFVRKYVLQEIFHGCFSFFYIEILEHRALLYLQVICFVIYKKDYKL